MGLSNSPYVGISEPKLLQLFQFYLSVDEIRRGLLNAQHECERLMRELLELNGMRSSTNERFEFCGQMYRMEMNEPNFENFEDSVEESEEDDIDFGDPISKWFTMNYPQSKDKYHGKRKSGDGELGSHSTKSEASNSTDSRTTENHYACSSEEMESSKHYPWIRKRRHSCCSSSSDELKKSRSISAPWPFGPPKDPNSLTPKECLIHIEKKEYVIPENGTEIISFFQEKLAHQTPELIPVQSKSSNTPSNPPISNTSEDNPLYEDAVTNSIQPASHSEKKLIFSDGLNERAQIFSQRTIIRAGPRVLCDKILKFESVAEKCDYRPIVHLEHNDTLPLTCVPANYNSTRQFGEISYYIPSLPPMIQALIGCINEIEARRLKGVGTNRFSWSKHIVKMLKKNFLRGLGASNISNDDLYLLCAIVKDFLRYHHEPSLISEYLNRLESGQRCLYQVVTDLPQPYKVTAHMILHLLRASDCPVCKMLVDSLAKVFGPTIIGYSSANQDPSAVLLETVKQFAAMQLRMPKCLLFQENRTCREKLVHKNRTSGTAVLMNSDPTESDSEECTKSTSIGINKLRKFFK